MNYIELSISVEPKELGSDILIAKLAEIGFESFVGSEDGFDAYILEREYAAAAVNVLLDSFSETLTIRTTSKVIPRKNWNEEWESNFQPIEVSGKCSIRAPFHEVKSGFDYNIIIEPKMSFGTGHHQTTQLMIQKLMQLSVKEKSLLDMGCGTGVLAILASMMGASPVTAIDIDDWSYENSVENVERNNRDNVFVHKGDIQKIAGKLFYTILANINKNVLLADMISYFKSLEDDGSIVLSGFFDTDVDDIKKEASKIGLKFESMLLNEQWALLHFTK